MLFIGRFSSPIGAFIFLIDYEHSIFVSYDMFSSPIGAFIFLIVPAKLNRQSGKGFRPLSGLLFS